MALAGQDYPELELGVGGLDLGDSDSDPEEPRCGRASPLRHLAPPRRLPTA